MSFHPALLPQYACTNMYVYIRVYIYTYIYIYICLFTYVFPISRIYFCVNINVTCLHII